MHFSFRRKALLTIRLPLRSQTVALCNTLPLSLMFAAGTMAICFRALTGDFQLFRWSINLWLAALPVGLLLLNLRQSTQTN